MLRPIAAEGTCRNSGAAARAVGAVPTTSTSPGNAATAIVAAASRRSQRLLGTYICPPDLFPGFAAGGHAVGVLARRAGCRNRTGRTVMLTHRTPSSAARDPLAVRQAGSDPVSCWYP